MHKVKCTVCGEIFDRDKVQAVKSGARRYAHYKCMPEGELVPLEKKENLELTQLKEYIANLLKEQYVPARVNKQIKEYKEKYNYTYSGMLKALIWFYEVKGNSIDKANGGIGIIPYIYKDAYNYYYNLFLAKSALEQKINPTEKIVREVVISSPRAKLRKPKLFYFLEEVEEEKNGS